MTRHQKRKIDELHIEEVRQCEGTEMGWKGKGERGVRGWGGVLVPLR